VTSKWRASVRRAVSGEFGISTIALGVIFILIGVGATLAGATKPNPDHKVTLCHATDSYTNPYVVITTDVASVLHHGHGDHDGPVFSPALPKHTKWGDIIPPFNFGPGETYAGKNWTAAGISIFDDACEVPANTTTTQSPPTTTPPPTTLPPPPSTTTTQPGETTTTSSAPGPTTSTTLGSATTTTTTQPGATTTSSVTPVTTGSTGTTVTTAAPPVTTEFVSPATTSATHGSGLAFTGGRDLSLAVDGIAFITAGFVLIRRRRAHAR